MTCCQAYSDATAAGACCSTTRVNCAFRAEHQLHGRHRNNFTPCLPVTDLLLLFFPRKRVPVAGLTRDGCRPFPEIVLGTDADITQWRRHLLQCLGKDFSLLERNIQKRKCTFPVFSSTQYCPVYTCRWKNF